MADVKELWLDFGRQCEARVESAFEQVRCTASDSRMVRSRLDVVDDGDISTTSVILEDGQDDVVVVHRYSMHATGGSGGGVDDGAMSQDGNADAMSQDV